MAEYIEREAVLKEISTAQESLETNDDKKWEKNKPYFKGLAWANRIILESPAADVAGVKRGEWIMRGGKLYCSSCQQRACVTRDSEDFWYTAGTDFCPNCGAKMGDCVPIIRPEGKKIEFGRFDPKSVTEV